MVGPSIQNGMNTLIDFQFPMSDLIAVLPYVIPIIYYGTILLFYQRHMARDSMKRNLLVFLGALSYIGAFLLVLYAGFGSVWWGPDELTFGSWWTFVTALQATTDLIFGTMLGGVLYLVGISVVFAILAYFAIAPPDPDFVAIREELRAAQESERTAAEEAQQLKAKTKELTEFITEKEGILAKMEEELELLKQKSSEAEKSAEELRTRMDTAKSTAEIDPEKEKKLLAEIAKNEAMIDSLQSEIADLRLVSESKKAARPTKDVEMAGIETQVKNLQTRVDDMNRRAETASEIADSLISDLAELMAQVESSQLDPAAKIALTTLMEGLGRSVGRVSRPAAEKDAAPRVEMIGAVMMVHEIVDSIKKLTRQAATK